MIITNEELTHVPLRDGLVADGPSLIVDLDLRSDVRALNVVVSYESVKEPRSHPMSKKKKPKNLSKPQDQKVVSVADTKERAAIQAKELSPNLNEPVEGSLVKASSDEVSSPRSEDN